MQTNPKYKFGPYRLDPDERVLRRCGKQVGLTPKAFDILLKLIENRQHLLRKKELMEAIWPESFVEEGNLTFNISVLRKALGDEAKGRRRYIETVPRQGYRFVASVQEFWGEDQDSVTLHRTRLHPIAPGGTENPAITEEVTRVKHGTQSGHRHLTGVPTTVKSLAVIPFLPLNLDPTDEYLGVGMADALITRLSNIGKIRVCPTSSVLRSHKQAKDPVKIGRELGVEFVLEGSLQKSGKRIRVTVRLSDVRKNMPLWAQVFDEDFTDMFAVEDSISKQVVSALTLELNHQEQQRLTKRYTDNSKAYQAYLRGRLFWNKRTEEGVRKGIQCFREAIDEDPSYTLAHVGLSDSFILLAVWQADPSNEAFAKAKAAALKAVEIDDSLAEARTSLAHVELHEWNWQYAEQDFHRALAMNPMYPPTHYWYAELLAAMGRLDEALEEQLLAQELDPFSLIVNNDVAWILYLARKYDQAIQQSRKVLEMDPNFLWAHLVLGRSYEQAEVLEKAIEEFQTGISLSKDNPAFLSALGRTYALMGNRVEALKMLDRLVTMTKEKPGLSYLLAEIYAGLGENDLTMEWLEKAYRERSVKMIHLKAEPLFESLYHDPRFADLLRRLGLHT